MLLTNQSDAGSYPPAESAISNAPLERRAGTIAKTAFDADAHLPNIDTSLGSRISSARAVKPPGS
jgi:hypothetical protein